MSFDGRPLLFLGCGKMGGAILAGLLARGVAPEQLHIIEPNREAVATFVQRGVHHHGSHESLPEDFSPALILLAVKPQVMEEALPLSVVWRRRKPSTSPSRPARQFPGSRNVSVPRLELCVPCQTLRPQWGEG